MDFLSLRSYFPSYDFNVFLSFIVEDTNKDFTRRLRAALKRARIPTLPDDQELLPARGENIFTADLSMIRRSRISIVVFSKGYASSSRCLDELVEIVHCKNTKGQALIPIFYHLNPSDIQRETGTFWEAFTRQEEQFRTNTKRVQRWRAALTEAARASGWVLEDDANRQKEEFRTYMKGEPRWGAAIHEYAQRSVSELEDDEEDQFANWQPFTRQKEKFRTDTKRAPSWKAALTTEAAHANSMIRFEENQEIKKIVGEVLDLMEIPEDSESKDSCFKMIKDLLNLGTSDICIVGMSWMKGIVSKTLAKVVYNEICGGFEGSTFILNIGEISRDPKYGLVHLQKKLLYDILKMENIPSINNVDEGINLIEETIKGKRVLIVLDGVGDLKQLNALVGNCICFGPGSRVIATSRGAQLLTELEAHGKYEVQGLHYWNSLKLFSWRASMMGHDYKVKFNPEVNVYNYKQLDMAGEGSEKQITLEILDLSGTNIKSLPESIVRFVNLKRLEVLDLKQTQISDLPKNPRWPMLVELFLHKNSKLKEIPPSFFSYMPALKVLNLSSTHISSLPESIVKLASLKELILSNCHDFMELSPEVGELKQLEVLDLEGTEISDLPENPSWPMLSSLFLHKNSKLKEIPPSFFNYMPALKVLNLSSTHISSLPESVVKLASLKELILSHCHDFMELSPEVGELKQLEVLDLEGTEISDLPENPSWPMLSSLFLHKNSKLKEIPPSFFSYMPALKVLNLSSTHISSLPESVVKLASLKRLILRKCHDFMELSPEVGELKQLEVLDLKGTKISNLPKNPRWPMLSELFLHNNKELRKIPPLLFDYMTALQTLKLSKTGVRSLPESIVKLVSLKSLILRNCHRFMRLSPEVGELEQLEVLDLEGTEIMDLPKEIMKLTNLTCLKFSIYGYMGDSSSAMQSDVPVPRNVISTLSCLKVLKISVNPDDKQWYELMAEDIIVTEVCNLNLKTLHLFFPSTDLVENFILNSRMWKHPSELLHFRFTVGHHVKRIMPRLPREAELELEKWDRCLKYTNGVTVPSEIKEVLQYSTAFFLERHESVKKLSDFGIGNMKKLKCCVVGECNEVEVITDGADARDHEEDAFGLLQYLCIYYMKNLRSIWRGPLQTWSLFYLKYLTLRTCPRLTTIFTKGIIGNLRNLEELTVDDCPSITTIVSCETSAELKTSYHFLPKLKRMSLHYVPELISISSGLRIAPRLQWLSFYNCPNLKKLWNAEESRESLTRIEGERSWWEALYWGSGRPSHLDEIFVPINILDC